MQKDIKETKFQLKKPSETPLVAIILLLQTKNKRTTSSLASALGVVFKTVYMTLHFQAIKFFLSLPKQ